MQRKKSVTLKQKAVSIKPDPMALVQSSTEVTDKEKPEKRKSENQQIENDTQVENGTQVETDIKVKRKKTKKKGDGSFNPNTYSYEHPEGKKKANTAISQDGNFLHMLYDTDKSFTNPEGELVEIKTTVMVDYQALIKHSENKGIDWADMCEKLLAVFSTVPSFRPAKAIEFSDTGSPVKLKTPVKGTELVREKKIGFLHFYSNRPNAIPLDQVKSQTELDPNSDFYSSPSYEAVQTVKEIVKTQNAFITTDLLKETKKENAAIFNVRSQNKVMKNEGFSANDASAQKYAEETKLFSIAIPMKWQWLHLVAHFIWGEDSQIPGNLVVGSKSGNADMDSVETQINYLAKQFPEGFKLVVEADLIEGTHMGVKMRYFIETPKFVLPFDFDVQTPNTPHVSQPDYIKKFVHTLVDKSKESPQTSPKPPAKKKIEFEFPFFTREDTKEAEVQTTTATPEDDVKPIITTESPKL